MGKLYFSLTKTPTNNVKRNQRLEEIFPTYPTNKRDKAKKNGQSILLNNFRGGTIDGP